MILGYSENVKFFGGRFIKIRVDNKFVSYKNKCLFDKKLYSMCKCAELLYNFYKCNLFEKIKIELIFKINKASDVKKTKEVIDKVLAMCDKISKVVFVIGELSDDIASNCAVIERILNNRMIELKLRVDKKSTTATVLEESRVNKINRENVTSNYYDGKLMQLHLNKREPAPSAVNFVDVFKEGAYVTCNSKPLILMTSEGAKPSFEISFSQCCCNSEYRFIDDKTFYSLIRDKSFRDFLVKDLIRCSLKPKDLYIHENFGKILVKKEVFDNLAKGQIEIFEKFMNNEKKLKVSQKAFIDINKSYKKEKGNEDLFKC